MKHLHKKPKQRWLTHNKENKEDRQKSIELLKYANNASLSKKLKTQPNQDRGIQQFRETLFSPSCIFQKSHRPFLENKKIIFNTRGIRRKQESIILEKKKKTEQKQTNIDKLKRQIQELDKDDFISYRSKTNHYSDDIKVVENARISKYNHQNSMIAEFKGQTCIYKPIIHRPTTTISISGKVSRNCLNYSMPHKYFSKPKKKSHNEDQSKQKNQVLGEQIVNVTKPKLKPEELFIGLNNMLRGHAKHRKNYSQFSFI